MGIFSDRGRGIQQWTTPQPTSDNINSNRESKCGIRRSSSNGCGNKLVRQLRFRKPKQLHNNDSRRGVSIHPNIFWTWANQPDDHTKSHLGNKRNRHNKYVYPVIAAGLVLNTLVPLKALAESVGGVSATANPIANSSGSVTNQAIQVLQGPYITNTYGGGVQCQGSTFNLTPYVQFADSRKDPWVDFYNEPQYNVTDVSGKTSKQTVTVKNYPWESWYDTRTKADGSRWFPDGEDMQIEIDVDGPDGVPDAVSNGNLDPTWHKPVRTDMSANQSFNAGLSATLSIPLNRKLVRQCHEAAQAQIAMQTQLISNKRLDFEIARLKNCGELKKAGIFFHPASPYHSVCADVVVTNPGGKLVPHTHNLPQNQSKTEETSSSSPSSEASSSSPSSSEVVPSSPDTDQSTPPVESDGKKSSQGWRWPWSSPSSQEVSPPASKDQQAALLGGPMTLPQPQSSQ